MIALVAALWAYDGWSDVVTMAGEVERPQRSMPLALVGGVAIVGALYMLTNAAIQYVLPAASIAMADRPAADAMRVVAGQWGDNAGVDRHGGQHLRDLCRIFAFGSARTVCSRTGWPFLQATGARQPKIPNAFDGIDSSGSFEFAAAACHRKISGVVLAGDLQ